MSELPDWVVERCGHAKQNAATTGKWPETREVLAEFLRIFEECGLRVVPSVCRIEGYDRTIELGSLPLAELLGEKP